MKCRIYAEYMQNMHKSMQLHILHIYHVCTEHCTPLFADALSYCHCVCSSLDLHFQVAVSLTESAFISKLPSAKILLNLRSENLFANSCETENCETLQTCFCETLRILRNKRKTAKKKYLWNLAKLVFAKLAKHYL